MLTLILFYFMGECHNLKLGAQSIFTMGNKVAFLEKKLKVFKLGFGQKTKG
jgi:hypothetical protein